MTTPEPEDAMTQADIADLDDGRQRALTFSAIDRLVPWPLGDMLPLRRWVAVSGAEGYYETGFVGPSEPLKVRTEERTVRQYADAESLVNDGWRVD